MLKRPSLILLSTLLALPASPALAYNSESARWDCQNRVSGWLSEYRDARDFDVRETGYDTYEITGVVTKKSDNQPHTFSCRVYNREVVNWNVSPDAKNRHKDRDKALAIGAGIIGLVALASMANRNKEQQTQYDNYQNGKGNAFADSDYLQKECAHNLKQTIDRDHGQVRDVQIYNASLNNRQLTGNGQVTFDRSGARSLSFTCYFDRDGRIYDGNYQYR